MTAQRLRHAVPAEMRAAEMEFSLSPVAAGVLACRGAEASRPAEQTVRPNRKSRRFECRRKVWPVLSGRRDARPLRQARRPPLQCLRRTVAAEMRAVEVTSQSIRRQLSGRGAVLGLEQVGDFLLRKRAVPDHRFVNDA